MRRPLAPLLVTCVALAATALPGCGGDGSPTPSTTGARPAAADQAFRRAVAAERTTLTSIGTDIQTAIDGAAQRSDAELAQQFGALAGRAQAALTTLDGLRPPASARDEVAALRTAVEAGVRDLRAIARAADAGDAAAAESSTRALVGHSPAIGDASRALATAAGVESATADSGAGKISVVYEPPRTAVERIAQQTLQLGGTDGVAAGFTQRFELPTDLTIRAVRGFVGPNYDSSTKTITLSYGFVDYVAGILRRADPEIGDEALGGQLAAIDGFILVHELGHAFTDVFQLPLTGREEDSVDQLATVFLVGGVNNGAQYALNAARFFRLLFDDRKALKQSDYWDEHSLSVQRAYDIACLVAGSSQANFDGIRRLRILGAARLQRCPAEWTKISAAWRTLLAPHLRG